MTIPTRLGDKIARSPGDPSVIAVGPSAMPAAERGARLLGWLSLGLGAAELLAAPTVARALGVEGREAVIRGCGAREIASGVLTLSINPRVGLSARLLGDAADAALLVASRRGRNGDTAGLDVGLALVIGLGLADAACRRAIAGERDRASGPHWDYSNRSGLPRGVDASRGLARDGDNAAAGAPGAGL